MSASCEEEMHTARKRKVFPLLKGNEMKLWIYKKKELKQNLIFSCWSLINISSDEAFWSPHSFSGTAGRTETFHFIFMSPLKTLVHQRGPTGERTIPRERPISFSIPNTQFLTKLSTSIIPVWFFGITAATFFSKPVISSLPMPQNFGVTRAELPFALYSAIWPTHIIKTLVNAAMYSAIAIGLLGGITILSVCVCVFGAMAYTVASRKTKDMQGFKIRTPVLSFFTRIFHGYICLEVAPLTTKLTVIGTW